MSTDVNTEKAQETDDPVITASACIAVVALVCTAASWLTMKLPDALLYALMLPELALFVYGPPAVASIALIVMIYAMKSRSRSSEAGTHSKPRRYAAPRSPKPTAHSRYAGLGVLAGQICPQTGRWEAPRLDNAIELVRQGDRMPGPTEAALGPVSWLLLRDPSAETNTAVAPTTAQ